MDKSRIKQLKKAGKQFQRGFERADKAVFNERNKKFGIPLGRKHPDWGRVATYGVAATLGAVGAKGLGKSRGDSASHAVEAAAERGAQRGAQRGVQGSRGESNGKVGKAVNAARRAASRVQGSRE